MIRIVTENPNLINEELYQKISVSEALHILNQEPCIATDTETTGLSPHSNVLTLVQFGTENYQIVVDTLTVNIRYFKNLLEDKNKLFVFHNAKFDLQFFYKHGIIVKKVYDSYLMECLLHLGYPKGMYKHSLEATIQRYLHISVDKSERKYITSRINSKSILYAANDVKHLIPVMNVQLQLLQQKDLLVAARFENSFVRVLAYVEFCGIRLDVNKWKEKMDSDRMQIERLTHELNKWVIEYNNPKYINYQTDLFSQNDTGRCSILWSSPAQVVPLFEELGFDLNTIDKKTKRPTKSVGIEIIKSQAHKSPIASLYVEYKKYSKSLTAFGQNYIDEINPDSGKIHSNFTQLMNTTRLSSGGDDNEDIESVNIQNIPADDVTRACFIPEDGDLLIDVDYTAQEDLVFTELSREEKLIEFYNDTKNKRDGHSFVAKMCYPDILKDVPELEIADKYPKLRKNAKKAKFAIHYGGNGDTIAKNLGISKEEGYAIEKSYLESFPGIKAYFDTVTDLMMKNGYILINPILKHKRFIYNWEEINGIKKEFTKEFWTEYRKEKELDSVKFNEELKPKVRKYFVEIGKFKRDALNSPVQGTAAMITKLAAMYLFDALEKNDLLFIVKIHNLVHDEILVGCPHYISDSTALLTQKCMEKAGKFFVKVVTLKAKPLIGNHWVH